MGYLLKDGWLDGWKVGWLEDWKDGRVVPILPCFHPSDLPSFQLLAFKNLLRL
jgi:hypothetical protein